MSSRNSSKLDMQVARTKRAVIPPGFQAACDALHLSAAIHSGNHLFLTGATGGLSDGTMPPVAQSQIENAFAKIKTILAHAGLPMDAVVEMTSYHIGLRQHFETFDAIRLHHFSAPYPAWTAVEVAGLRRDGAQIEIRIIAAMGSD